MKRKIQSPWCEETSDSKSYKAETSNKEADFRCAKQQFSQWRTGSDWRLGNTYNVIVNDVSEMEALLCSFEIETKSHFVKSKTSSNFGSTDMNKKTFRLCWNETVITHPYKTLNNIRFDCHHGPPNSRQTVALKATEGKDHEYVKQRICLRPTKKLWCPASITAVEMIAFTDFKSTKMTKWKKDQTSKIIKDDFNNGGANLKMERKICVKLPHISDHKNHTPGIQVMSGDTKMHQMLNELHDSASKGHAELVIKLIGNGKRKALLNAQNDKGWTALMFAARNGRVNVADALIKKGCDVNITTKSGQTALDIAKFWNHNSIVDLISGRSNASTSGQVPSADVNFFGKNPLDRCAALRVNKNWVEEQMHQPTTRFILFHNSNPFVIYRDNCYETCPVFYNDISFMFDTNPKPIYIFLGIGSLDISENNGDRVAWFALDVSSLPEERLSEFCKDAEVLSAKNRYAIMSLDEMQAGVIAQSKSLLTWHHRYKFCPTCGGVTNVAEAGYKRVCSNKDCISLQGIHNTSYPRLDPVVIMLVISPDKQKCLLGRQTKFPPGMFSCLAGFMEPGETIEDAVRREVMEESGVKVGLVQYHSCQPWPMPMQLMIGCLAYATSNHIQVDQDELETARWFPRLQVAEMLSGVEVLSIPPKQAIAHQLIRAWVGMGSNL